MRASTAFALAGAIVLTLAIETGRCSEYRLTAVGVPVGQWAATVIKDRVGHSGTKGTFAFTLNIKKKTAKKFVGNAEVSRDFNPEVKAKIAAGKYNAAKKIATFNFTVFDADKSVFYRYEFELKVSNDSMTGKVIIRDLSTGKGDDAEITFFKKPD